MVLAITVMLTVITGTGELELVDGHFNVLVDLCGIFKKATIYEV